MAERVAPLVDDVGWLVLNLECPIGVDGLEPAPKPGGGDPMSSGEAALAYLPPLRVGVAGLANNHVYDFGPEGVVRTRRALADAGIPCLGAGLRTSDVPEVAILEGATRVGLWNAANATLWPASDRSEGVEPLTPERGREALRRMDELGATFRAALVHAGLEGTNRPDPADKELVDTLVEAGFDLVAACHSHRISGGQAVARGAGGTALALHGLGSLSSSVSYSELEREGLVVVVGLDGDGRLVEAEVRTIALADDGWGEVPDREVADAMAERFRALSREIEAGSFRTAFYGDMSSGLVRRQLRDAAKAYRNAGVRGLVAKLRRARLKHLRRLLFKLSPRRPPG
jgi:poly-gamma-glutamate capsule biosynthesis protein CapA/YwtB (metallophosphatase superfamily)